MDQVMWGSEDWKSLLQENIRRSEIGDQAGVDNPFTEYGIFFFSLFKQDNQSRKKRAWVYTSYFQELHNKGKGKKKKRRNILEPFHTKHFEHKMAMLHKKNIIP